MRVIDEHVIHPDQAFRLLSFEIDGSLGERHRHAALELTWIERGAGVRFVGDSAAPFESGDLVLLGSNLPHAWASSGPPHPGALKATVIQFPPHLLTQLVLPELATLRPLAARAGKGLRVTGQTQTRVTARLSRLPQSRTARASGGAVRHPSGARWRRRRSLDHRRQHPAPTWPRSAA